jgi:hypothetical protein
LKRLKLSQYALAKAIGVPQIRVSEITGYGATARA